MIAALRQLSRVRKAFSSARRKLAPSIVIRQCETRCSGIV
jgi:hypothetical protein